MAEQKFSDYADKEYLVYTKEDAASFPDYLRPLFEFDWADGKGVKWGDTLGSASETLQLTWSVSNSDSTFTEWHYNWNPPINERLGVDPTSQEIQAVANSFDVWEQYVDIDFSQVVEDASTKGNIRTIFVDMGGTGIAYLAPDGEINISNSLREDIVDDQSSFGEHILTHEIGHAVFGLSDVSRLPGWDEPGQQEAVLLPWYFNNQSWTVMSYIPVGSTYSESPMILDVAAVQALYGVNETTGLGDTTYSWSEYPIHTIWDVSGNDTIDLSNFSDDLIFNTSAGSLIEINDNSVVGVAYGVDIENFIGGPGNDVFYGGSNEKSLSGGLGSDTFFIDLKSDLITDGGQGFDLVILNSADLPHHIKSETDIADVNNFNGIELISSQNEAVLFTDQIDNYNNPKSTQALNYVSIGDTSSLLDLSALHLPVGKIYSPIFEGSGTTRVTQDGDGVIVNPLGYLFLSDTNENVEKIINFQTEKGQLTYSGSILYNSLEENNIYEINLNGSQQDVEIIDIGGQDEIKILDQGFVKILDSYYKGDDLVFELQGNSGTSELIIQNQKSFGTIEKLTFFIDDSYRTFQLMPDNYVMELATTLESNKTTIFDYSASSDSFIPGYKSGDGLFGGTDHSEYQDLSKIDEFIIDGNGNDVIFGSDGSDQIEARLGDDLVYGGIGNDRLLGWQGDDSIYGEEGNDRIFGDYEHAAEHGNDQIYGGPGDDYIRAEGGDDYLDGGPGDDVIEADGPGAERLGLSGNDTVVLSLGNDNVDGSGGLDTIFIPDLFDVLHSVSLNENTLTTVIKELSGANYLSTYTNFEKVSFKGEVKSIESFVSKFGEQSHSEVAVLSDGKFVVTWRSESSDGDGYGIAAQLFSATGVAVGSEMQVNETVAGDQTNVQVTALSNGGFATTWTSYGQDSDRGGVYAKIYDGSASVVAQEFHVNTTSTGNQGDYWDGLSLDQLSNGNIILAWSSDQNSNSSTDVYAKIISSTGATVFDEFILNSTTVSVQDDPKVTATQDGGFIAVWQSYDPDGTYFDIQAQKFNVDGVAQGAEFTVNSEKASQQLSPEITELTNSDYVVVWASAEQDTANSYGIFGQLFEANGTAKGAEFQVNTYVEGRQDSPSIAALSDGGFVVSWNSVGQDGSNYGVYAQKFTSAGAKDGSETRLAENTEMNQMFASIDATDNGNFIASWHSNHDGVEYTPYDIYADIYNGDTLVADVI